MENEFDLIAIGDIVTDAFIRLKEASVHCDVDKENCTISMAFGDKVPYEFVEIVRAVGNSSNASVSAARLGLKSALVSNMGNDQNGRECLDVLKENNVSTNLISIHENKDTNYHYVLWYEDERTILVKHQEYNYHLPELGEPRWLYLSSLAPNSLAYHVEIAEYLKNHPNVKLAFQPGTFQIQFGAENIKEIYLRTEVFFCNVEEAKRILGLENHTPVDALLKKLAGLGPKTVVITDGPRGSYVFDGMEMWSMIPYPDSKPPYERTGAGDAFSSTFTSCLAMGLSIPEALRFAGVNSMSVVQHIGAQKGLLSRQEIENYLKSAPTEYRPKLIQ